ncbi:MAG: BolA family transcriptional regulator [Gammaproteobacteria bacterium]|nr:MAG: BolA family transcriptional regulator [Gammaproteobacteria bacterium]
MPQTTQQAIEKKLTEVFQPTLLTVIDESHRHTGHAGAQSGKGHYAITIRAEAFANKPPLARHRMIYEALADLMSTHIHALQITASV